MPRILVPGQIIVLAVKVPDAGFVNWYHTEDTANALFDSAVKTAPGNLEEVLLFRLDVPDMSDVVNVRQRAETAAKDRAIQALRHWTPAMLGN